MPLLTENLIEQVKKYPIIYNSGHSDFKNIRKKDKVWETIGAELNVSAGILKKKWKNLRDTYAKYIHKSKQKKLDSGSRLKKWQWADHMKVFHQFLIGSRSSNIVFEADCNVYNSDTSFDNESGDENPANSDCQDLLAGEDHYYMKYELQSEGATPRCNTPTMETSVEIGTTASAESIARYFENKSSNKSDSLDLLFLAHAATIRSFTKKRQAITKLRIAKVIMEEEMLNNEEQSSTRPPCTCNGPQ